MLIDWFTVVAQLINFVILLVALKVLLFDRIVQAMEERRDRIEARRREADESRTEADEEAERLRRQRREIENEKSEILNEARREAEKRREELLDEARSEVDRQEQRWLDALHRKQDRLARHLQQSAGERIVDSTRRVLTDLADADLEDAVVAGFVKNVESLGEDERDSVAESLRSSDGAVLIRTGFELSEGRRDSVRDALRSLGAKDLDFEWERDSEILAGIQVETEVARIGWTIDGYLDELLEEFQRSVRATIDSAREPEDTEHEKKEPEDVEQEDTADTDDTEREDTGQKDAEEKTAS